MSAISDRVDQLFAEWDKPGTPGCSLAVIRDGEIVFKKGYGLANLEYGIPNTPSTIFHVASMSKQFTAWAITHLASQGKLSLDNDIRNYLPEVPDFGETITLRHLIHHTSGLRDQWELLILAGWRMDDVITADDILEMVKGQRELNFKPGGAHSYCNTGYTLMGLIVQKVSGKSLREYCQENLFAPLGMDDTHFHDDYQMIVPNRAYSYQKRPEGGFRHAVLSYSNVGATSLFTTVEDMARWDQNFYTGEAGGMAVIEQMHCQGILNNGETIDYAFGLMIDRYRGLRTVEHSGGDAGYRTDILRFPEKHFSVVVLCNLGSMGPTMLARQVADIYLEGEFPDADPPSTPDTGEAETALEPYAGSYVNPESHQALTLVAHAGMLSLGSEKGLPLVSLGPKRLGARGIAGFEFAFEVDANQAPTGFQLRMPGMGMTTFERVRPVDYSETELEDFAGEYCSPELKVSYSLSVAEGKLCLTRRKYGTTPLNPVTQDTFNNDMLNLHFARDVQNRPTGFTISTGRIRNLRFERC